MPARNFAEYAREITAHLNGLLSAGLARDVDMQVDQRSASRGLVAGCVVWEDGSELHFREYIDLTQSEIKLMYAYHYQNAQQALVFRYDNAQHRPKLLQLEHKHTSEGIVLGVAPTLAQVLD